MVFRVYLAVVWTALCVFTLVVAANHGLGLFGVFFGDIAKAGWPGQFNADFLTLLALSGLWCAWRGRWSAGAIFLGVLVFVGGGVMLMATLFVLHRRHHGDMRNLLLGANA
jgi:hypothetical protein